MPLAPFAHWAVILFLLTAAGMLALDKDTRVALYVAPVWYGLLALGFWAAGYYGRSALLLVAWVAAFALIRGVRDIVLAFQVREIQHGAADAQPTQPRARAAATP
jgi:hypothetical protein